MLMKTRIIQHAEAKAGIVLGGTACAHQRLIDDILTKGGKRTGKVRCLECLVVFDDPYKGFI